ASVTTGDLGIGQVWEDFVSVADVVLPMVYPSHYYRGAFGYAWPNGQPYHVVHSALTDALKRSQPLPGSAEIRPFLQAFTLGRRLPLGDVARDGRCGDGVGIGEVELAGPRATREVSVDRADGHFLPRLRHSRPCVDARAARRLEEGGAHLPKQLEVSLGLAITLHVLRS